MSTAGQDNVAPLVDDESFVIHSINSYTHIALSDLADHFKLGPGELDRVIRDAHDELTARLQAQGVDYADLKQALVPQPGRHEVAFVFDSTRTGSNSYGHTIAEQWIPTLRRLGPEKTVVKVGDVLRLPSDVVWTLFEKRLVGDHDFPRLSTELYFVVYMTNISPGQLQAMHADLGGSSGAYLGYVDCSTWNVLKLGLFLPQVALRIRDSIITDQDDTGTPNQVGYPFEENGFAIVGVAEELYGPLLGYRLDNGVPKWADDDSSIALTVLGGDRQPMSTTSVTIDERRIAYLTDGHGGSLVGAGLAGLDREELAESIRAKLERGLIYNLRFVEGKRAGVRDSTLDAMMFSVQVEFPHASGSIRRYLVGMKYLAASHTCEVVTFF